MNWNELKLKTTWNDWINLLFLRRPTHMQKNQYNSSIQPRHIAYIILWIIFGMPRCDWPHQYEWTNTSRCTYVYLTTSKKSTSSHCFESLWPYFTKTTWNNWINLLLLQFPNHRQKTNFLTQLILEIKLTIWQHAGHAQSCLTIPT